MTLLSRLRAVWCWAIGNGQAPSWPQQIAWLKEAERPRLVPPVRPLRATKQNVRDFPKTGTR